MTDFAPAHSAGDHPPTAEWSGEGSSFTLRIAGEWRGAVSPLPAAPVFGHGALIVEARELLSWDARLASSLWRLLSAVDRSKVSIELGSLPHGLQQILELALPAPPAEGGATPEGTTTRKLRKLRLRRPGWVTTLGQSAGKAIDNGKVTITFVGDVLLSAGRLMRGRSDMRWSDLVWQIDQTGPRSVPIVSIVSFLVSLIVAYMGAAQLQLFGAQSYIADLVTVGVVREIAALVTGIILAGRVGAAFAAQIGSMRANEEVDALRTLGVDPIDHLVLPRVLAMALVAPLLTAYAAIVGMGVGWLVAVGIYGVAPIEYVIKSFDALTMPHVLIGLFKGTVYAVLVALAGCRQGLAAGGSAEAVGQATTAAVVQSIVWMAVAASVLTVVFQRLNW